MAGRLTKVVVATVLVAASSAAAVEVRTSRAASVAPPVNTTPPVISGVAQDGNTLSTTTGSWSSPGALTYAYRWQRCDGNGANCSNTSATKSFYALRSADVGHQITVVVSATDLEGETAQASATPIGPVSAPPPPSNTALPKISGSAQDGRTLTTTAGSWSSPDFLSYRYEWQRCDGAGVNCTNIAVTGNGYAATSYKLGSVDVGHRITVVVTATDGEHQSGQASAKPTSPVVAPAPPSNRALPTIWGNPQEGSTIFVKNGWWVSPDWPSYTYRWQRCDGSGASCTNIPNQTNQFYVLTANDVGHAITAVVTATDKEGQSTSTAAPPITAVVTGEPPKGIHKIQHVVVIMQENRSFDSYFGTYPGADGIPSGTCLPDPLNGGCVKSFHDTSDINTGGRHSAQYAAGDIDGGKMDGFVGQAEAGWNCTVGDPACVPCTPVQQTQCIDVTGYHDNGEIPNYWTYARDFVLQDQMFEPNASWSLPGHLFMVSEWSARCTVAYDPFSCRNSLDSPSIPNGSNDLHLYYAWTDITYLLHAANVSWGYYVFKGTEPDCDSDTPTCPSVPQSATTPGIWNPLPNFTDVTQDGQLGNIQSLSNFFTVAENGTLPAVSWIVPTDAVSEHPTARVSAGQTYVTGLVNAIMHSPDWPSTAIFLSWDDWGGFYDHVVPPSVDQNGYGLRVPGLVISAYAKAGYIDHQILSHDAYNKFIEDDFLGGERLDPKNDGRPDPRPDVRETQSQLGDLKADFNFNQPPRPPKILPTCPQTDLTPTPNC